MNIQSLSIVVPNKHCINNCKFCVSHMHCEDYKDQMNDNLPFFDLYLKDYLKRLQFAKDNGCNTIMLTGNSEPQQNRKFLTYFGLMMQLMQNPFRWVEIQTTGVMLDRNYLRFLRNHVGVNTISISLSSFDSDRNAEIISMPENMKVDIENLCNLIKEYDFNLRLSINMTKEFAQYYPKELFDKAKQLGADQVTLRKMYTSGNETSQDKWLMDNYLDIKPYIDYVLENGRVIGILPYGSKKYSLNGMSTVIDTDCMAKAEMDTDTYKYLVLRPDCKLYSSWDDKASLIF